MVNKNKNYYLRRTKIKKLLDFTQTIDEVENSIESYLKNSSYYNKQVNEIRRDYRSGVAAQKIKELDPPNQGELLSYLDDLNAIVMLDIQKVRSSLREAANISSDWAFLNLPTELPLDMLQTLADRNRNDSIFLHGLSTHCKKHGIDPVANDLDLRCYLDLQEETLASFFKSERESIAKDLGSFDFTQAFGYYDRVKESLSFTAPEAEPNTEPEEESQ